MEDKYKLIEKGLIPLSKYWSVRLGFLDILNNTGFFIPLIEGRQDIGNDLEAMIRISKEWQTKDEHNVGEAGALYRLLQFASWKYDLGKKFVKEKTLKTRDICSNPDIVNWSIAELLTLDNNTPQWASASILTGNQENAPDDYFLNMSREALKHYEEARERESICELRYDDTLLLQAEAYLDLLKNGRMDFTPRQQDDYCFARSFNLIKREEGEKRWPELRGHESNRLEEIEAQLSKLEQGITVDSRDHRVVQAIAEVALYKNKKANYFFPECVSKSWPQFWKFLEYAASEHSTRQKK